VGILILVRFFSPPPWAAKNIFLVYHVLLHLHKRLSLGDFFRLIETGGPQLSCAGKLLEVYAREQNRDMLRDFYYSDDRRVESAVLSLEEAARMSVSRSIENTATQQHLRMNIQNPGAKITAVKAAQKFFSEDKDRSFEAKVSHLNVFFLLMVEQSVT
jgi:hypothetical protein